ncbi:MAG: cob(I)yrinic acid a,c-diamide adenosyltransferase [Oscillospiraceae bacterium]|jgi:cob(I)alamin adenosyltransferase
MTAMTHIYTGDGKGKTSCALGLALRFSGYGGNVIIVQFGKGRDTGELAALAKIPNIKVLRNNRDFGFWSNMTEESKNELRTENDANLSTAISEVKNGNCGLLVLDEVISAYKNGAVDRQIVDTLLNEKPPKTELVLTGRNAPQSFIERADYVSEIKKVRHPFDKGIGAREGVEF